MRFGNIVWRDEVADKVIAKHDVDPVEANEVLDGDPAIRFVEKGLVPREDVYVARGRTEAGRYLSVFFIRKLNGDQLVVTVRDMEREERKLYEKAKRKR